MGLKACVASVPVRAKCYCVAYERRFWSRENWGESKKGKGTGKFNFVKGSHFLRFSWILNFNF